MIEILLSGIILKQLRELQAISGLHLGNKIRVSHINYHRKKMNVKLAAQLLSESVTDALQFCVTKKIPGFIGCEATIKFIKSF